MNTLWLLLIVLAALVVLYLWISGRGPKLTDAFVLAIVVVLLLLLLQLV